MKTRPVSILIPVLNESGSVDEMTRQLLSMLESNKLTGEILFIDDGSVDSTWEKIRTLSEAHSNVRGLRLQRNFGKAAALAAGIDASRYELIVQIDGDLQDDPAEIPDLLKMLEGQFDLVSGWKQHRQDPWSRRFASRIFNGVVSLLTGVRLHDHNCGLKAGRRPVYESLSLSGGMHRFIPVLAASNGFRVGEKVVAHRPRVHGKSRYGWSRIPHGLMDLITVCFLTVHRERIQAMMTVSGLLAFLAGGIGILWMVIYWGLQNSGWIDGAPLHQRPLLWFSIGSFLAGLQILIVSFLSGLLVQRTNSSADRYLIADETSGTERDSTRLRKIE